ncbi:MAG: radical SAM protein [Clostridiales bacterium]|nr:radical SAM protein [Clostridiales bacterium]
MQEGSKTSSSGEIARIYIEQDLISDPVALKIMGKLPSAKVIPIGHYKDVFCRPRQQYEVQRQHRSLIIARNTGRLIYDGAPMCQDFGMENFSYANSLMNCIYDCDYCFLKGVYDTANIVVFVNFEDYKKAVEEKLAQGPLYLCISYDTDLMALNGLCGLCDMWTDYARDKEGLTIEIRTKSAPSHFTVSDHIIYAFTLSPDEVIARYEHGTPGLGSRLEAVRRALDSGANVRLCFDPLMKIEGFDEIYNGFIDRVASEVDLGAVRDMSVGTFRIPADYLKRMRRNCPMSEAAWYPYDNKDGVCGYEETLAARMASQVMDRLCRYTGKEKIYLWD